MNCTIPAVSPPPHHLHIALQIKRQDQAIQALLGIQDFELQERESQELGGTEARLDSIEALLWFFALKEGA